MKFVAVVPKGDRYESHALVEMTASEFRSLTGRSMRSFDELRVGESFSVLGLRDALNQIASKGSDIKRVRATMRTFLELTEDDAILEVLEKCGVPVVVEEPAKESSDADD
jgi:hypothetical protein